MWFNIAAANVDEEGREKRDALAKEMTSDQLAEAQKMAREMVEANPKLMGGWGQECLIVISEIVQKLSIVPVCSLAPCAKIPIRCFEIGLCIINLLQRQVSRLDVVCYFNLLLR